MLLALTSYTFSFGQVFKKDADGFKTGTYTRDQLKSDWQTKSGNGFSKKGKGEDRVSVVKSSSPDKGNALKVKFPKGKADSKESGAQWETDLKKGYEELYLSYDIKFSADFEFVKPGKNTGRTGKLPGLGGGLSFDDKDDRNTAWDGKLQFRDKDELEFYVKTPISNEKHFTWTKSKYTIAKNKWFNIEIRYKLNKVGKKDGIMQAWVDGKLLGEYKNSEFRKDAKVKINKMFFSTFYGGNAEADAPTKDVYAYFDNFVIDTKRINKKVGTSSGGSSSNTKDNNTTKENTTPTKDTTKAVSSNTCRGTDPISISGKIQAESYCKGKGVSKKSTYVTNIGKNDYIDFFSDIKSSGDYEVRYRVASNKKTGRGKVNFKLSGKDKGSVNIPNTGGTTKWKTIKRTIKLDKGKRTIRLTATGGGGWNFDYFEIRKKPSRKVISEIIEEKSEEIVVSVYPNPSSNGIFKLNQSFEWTVMTMQGQLVTQGNGNSIDLSGRPEGIYLAKIGGKYRKIVVSYY